MSGEGSEAAGAALLAALTGLSPPPNASGKGGSSSDSPGSGQGSDATTTTATSAGNNKKTPPSVTKSFNIGGSAALKAAASKGFKFPTFKFGKKEEKALAAKQSGGEINSPALSTKTTSSKDKDCKENEKCGSCLKVDKNERTFTYHINPDISEPPCKCAKVSASFSVDFFFLLLLLLLLLLHLFIPITLNHSDRFQKHYFKSFNIFLRLFFSFLLLPLSLSLSLSLFFHPTPPHKTL